MQDESNGYIDVDPGIRGDDQYRAAEHMSLSIEPAPPAGEEAPPPVNAAAPVSVECEALPADTRSLSIPSTSASGPLSAPAPAQESIGGSPRTQLARELTHKILASVETHLAKEVGPVARVLVAKYAKQSEDMASLEAQLEGHIPSVTGRFRFKKALLELTEGIRHGGSADATEAGLRTLQQRQRVAPAVSDQRSVPTPQQIQAAGAKLAAYLGPIAHVIAKREAESVVDLDTLLQRLTEAIHNDADRNGFRAACRDIGRG
jgi:serine/threonine-protein kinase